MKKENGVLIAGAIGVLAAIGIFAFRRILSNKCYHDDYHDHHRHFVNRFETDDHHGIEYLALR